VRHNAFGPALAAALVVSAAVPAPAAAAPRLIAYPSFRSAAGLALRGTAEVTGGVLRLTGGRPDQAGAAWSDTAIDPRAPFETTFDLAITGTGTVADGVAFVVQTDGRNALGGLGGSIGYGGLTHSVAVEFDTYRNPYDADANHVAVVSGGRADRPQPGAAGAPLALAGRPVHVGVGYEPARAELTVRVRGDGEPWSHVLTRTVDLGAVLGSGRAYVGFTGATGTSVSTQAILSWRLLAGA